MSFVHLDVKAIKSETEKALLCVVTKAARGTEDPVLLDNWDLWIPKSVIDEPDNYNDGDSNVTVSVQEWFAEKEGMFDDDSE